MAVGFQMVLVLAAAFHVHIAGVPVAGADGGGGSPVRPDAELGIAEPLWTGVGIEGVAGGLKRALGNFDIGDRLRLTAA
jgi:hypothetical protein